MIFTLSGIAMRCDTMCYSFAGEKSADADGPEGYPFMAMVSATAAQDPANDDRCMPACLMIPLHFPLCPPFLPISPPLSLHSPSALSQLPVFRPTIRVCCFSGTKSFVSVILHATTN